MKIYSSAQIRAWDAATINREPVTPEALIERASLAFVGKFQQLFPDTLLPVAVVCGPGNNGADGQAVAKLLQQAGYGVAVWVPETDDVVPHPFFSSNAVVVDALFGTGLNRPLTGRWEQVVNQINALPNTVVSIDIPSGLPADGVVFGALVQADYTIAFERPKLSFFFPENALALGKWFVVPIGLLPAYEAETDTPYHLTDLATARSMIRPRNTFAHKGVYGHALLVAGAYGKMGAAVLAAKGALRAGVGLLSVHAPRCGNIVLQTAVPEAMHQPDDRARMLTHVPDTTPFDAVGVGPGIGQAPETAAALFNLLRQANRPMVLDADALNLLGLHPDWWPLIPKESILTPHPKEFERLFGKTANSLEQLEVQMEKSASLGVILVRKGAYTAVSTPDGLVCFNTTGNPGMATGGSGDVLTGILTALLAQGYAPADAARLGVYLHGLAGDLAAEAQSQEALIASDMPEHLGKAFLLLHGNSPIA